MSIEKDKFLNNCYVLDTETTSLSYNEAEVIEFGYVLYNVDMEHNWFMHNQLYKPTIDITPEISAITNITNAMVSHCLPFTSCLTDATTIIDVIGSDCVCVAHNAFYDRKVLETQGITHGKWLCTMRIAKKLYHNDDTVTQFKLAYLRYRFGILDPAIHTVNAHRAADDALMTAMLLDVFIDEMISRNILDVNLPFYDQIVEWMEAPIIFDTMPFGKHKGKKLVDVPLDYWKWALSNLDSLDEDSENYDKDFAASVSAALDS